MHVKQGMQAHRRVFVAAAVLLATAGCEASEAPGTYDCEVPQDARQRFVREADQCNPDSEPRVLGFAWNGYDCGPVLTGDCRHAGCEGTDCGQLFRSRARCRGAYAGCEGTCGPRAGSLRDEVPTHPICRANPSPGGVQPPALYHQDCSTDDDCRAGVNGSCLRYAGDLVYDITCEYDQCFTDADCAEGRVCAPLWDADPRMYAQSNLFCVRAACRSSADCRDGVPCALEYESLGTNFSPRPNDYFYSCGEDICGTDAPTEVYRITALQIPAMADVAAGLPVGHNVDGTGSACGVEDFPGGIDNAFMTLSAGLLELGSASPLDLQAELDAALACATPSSTCEPLTMSLTLQRCLSQVVVSVRDAAGRALTTHVPVILDGGSDLRVSFPALTLHVPVRTPTGIANLELALEAVTVTGTLTATGSDDLVIGGVVRTERLLAVFTPVLTELDGGPSQEDVEGVLDGLDDVQFNGVCGAVSVGLRGVAELTP